MIYFDNGATTYPKPINVLQSTCNALRYDSFNSGRGGYAKSLAAAGKIYSVREKIAKMFGFEAENVAFTKNCTEALNIAIKGVLQKGDHVIISSLEHNSVSRVVNKMQNDGIIEYDIADFSFDDEQTVKNFESLIKPNTKAVVCMHSSNVFGVVFPIKQIGEMCKRHNIIFIVDGAQGAGAVDINAGRDNIDILCAPGHKSLYGPMGTGFIAVKQGIKLNTIAEGGTGSGSLELVQPDFMPDRLESGTLNNSGIIGLGKGIDFINSVGIENIYEHEFKLSRELYRQMSAIKSVKLYTPAPVYAKSMPIISFNYGDYSSEKVAALLAEKNVCVRAGYHCSPLAHKHFGTLNTGTVRISLGYFNKAAECHNFVTMVKNL